MNKTEQVEVLYFTDILCVWAYLSQVRMDKLKSTFSSRIKISNHFISVFGAVESKLEKNWANKGGCSAYCQHVQNIALEYNHIELHPDIWTKNIPKSSTSCHLFLKAIQILQSRDEMLLIDQSGSDVFDVLSWEFRLAFFKDIVDISNLKNQMMIAEKLNLPYEKIKNVIENGEAFAALDMDLQLKEKYGIIGSPSLVLNEGRQIIYGNVGYRVIEANIQELLSNPFNQASWC